MLKRLTDERLLVTSPGTTGGEGMVELSHEALIRNWDKLKGWLNEDREFLLWRRRFSEFVSAWRQDNQKEKGGGLLAGSFLIEAENFFAQRGDRLTNEERSYITASADERNRQRELVQSQEEEDRRRKKRYTISATCAAVVMTALAFVATFFGINSRREATMSFALQLAAQSGQKVIVPQLADALLLGVASAEQQVRYETTDNLWRLMVRLFSSGLRGYIWADCRSDERCLQPRR